MATTKKTNDTKTDEVATPAPAPRRFAVKFIEYFKLDRPLVGDDVRRRRFSTAYRRLTLHPSFEAPAIEMQRSLDPRYGPALGDDEAIREQLAGRLSAHACMIEVPCTPAQIQNQRFNTPVGRPVAKTRKRQVGGNITCHVLVVEAPDEDAARLRFVELCGIRFAECSPIVRPDGSAIGPTERIEVALLDVDGRLVCANADAPEPLVTA